MTVRMTRRAVVAGVLAAVGGTGCGINPFLIPGILFGGRESRIPAEFPFTVPAKHDDAKVVILVSSMSGLPTDLAGVDRTLNTELIRVLEARLKENEEKVLVKKVQLLDEYKTEHPKWRTAKPYDIGKDFAADYIVDVEIEEMTLFKPGNTGTWLQGRAVVSVNAYDLSKPLKDPAYKYSYTVEYPKDREIPVESRSDVTTFRQKFIERMAFEISLKFTSSTSDHQRHLMVD